VSNARPQTPRALSVDAWYTLLYIRTPERRRLDAVRHRLWSAPLREAGLSAAAGDRLLAARERWVRYAEAHGRTPAVAEQLRWLERTAARRLRLDDLPEQLDRTLLGARVLLAPGASEALDRLERMGVPLAVVSNVLNESGGAARTVLDRLGLLARFRVVFLSCEHPWAKPSPEPFRLVARYLGLAPAETAHLGDLAYDVRGARSAGFAAWWYAGLRRWNRYLPGQVDPDRLAPGTTVRAWAELPSRLA
jgi:FMN phosphatase YigB (HAD superfamily)